jgi:predicted DNA-binding transcriptional regulator AlpA
VARRKQAEPRRRRREGTVAKFLDPVDLGEEIATQARRLRARYATGRLVRIAEVCRMTGLSRTTIWRLQRARDFPSRIQISQGAVGWHLSDIEEWMRHRSQPLRRVQLR